MGILGSVSHATLPIDHGVFQPGEQIHMGPHTAVLHLEALLELLIFGVGGEGEQVEGSADLCTAHGWLRSIPAAL